MGKKILYIVLGALLVFGLLFLVWTWFFSGGSTANPTSTGTLGSAGNTTQTSGSGANSNNGQIPLNGGAGATVGAGSYNAQGVYVGPGNGTYDANGNYVGTQTTTSSSGGGTTVGAGSYNAQGVFVGAGNGTYDANGNYVGTITNSSGSGSTAVGSTATGSTATGSTPGGGAINTGSTTTGTSGTTTGLTAVNGITWLGSPFNPADINSVSSGAGGFAPTITSQIGGSGSSGTTLVEALAGTAIAGTVVCAAQAFGITGGITLGITSTVYSTTGFPVSDLGTHQILAYSAGLQTAKNTNDFLGCIVNTIAKTALQAITVSVVNWINSGFKGQPSFVSNYQQFFTNTADLAAGAFIQGSGLAFLCSPFQLQIKIAIAQSYANRNAQSCSLTKVISDINGFMNGNFSQGGWGGLVSFTTVPTNNPYGAFAYAQAGLQTAQSNALANAKNNISPTGFLNLQQINCPNGSTGITANLGVSSNSQAAQVAQPTNGCTSKITTPGAVIADSLGAVNKSGVDQLGLTNDIDQIITALTSQLMTRILQNGLSSLSQTTTQTPADIAAQSQALSLLNQMQSETTLAQQLGSIYQGSISDIEGAQAELSNLTNCWSSVASSTNSTIAAQNAVSANSSLQSLGAQVTTFNNDITNVNTAIASLNQFVSQISSAASAADVTNVTNSYNAALSAGTFPSQNDLTTAQQNRTTLQSQLATTNQSTQTGLIQCQAAGGQ